MVDNQVITLKIRVLDAQGQFRGGTVDLEFKHRTLSTQQRGLDASREIAISGLRRAPTGDYQVTVTPTDVFKPQSQFVNIPASGFATMTVTIERAHIPGPQPDPAFVVKGTVHTAAGPPFTNGLVRAIHQNASGQVLLGEGRTDTQGNYVIKYSSEIVTGAINLRVQAFNGDGNLLAQSDPIAPAKREEVVNLTLPPPEPQVALYRVEGHIFFDHGMPAADLSVRLYNRGLGCIESLLGESKTNGQGFYIISYNSGSAMINIEVRVVDARGKEISLSATKFNAGQKEVLNLVVPASVQPLAPEYQRLTADLNKQLGGQGKLSDVRENSKCKDLTLLHQCTGWDARLIALAATAGKLSDSTGIPHDALYALLRTGLPGDPQQLALLSSKVVKKALGKAREA
ncbi:MAG: hypothetical protein WBV94_00985, partial [Blastocatellia bacterium]